MGKVLYCFNIIDYDHKDTVVVAVRGVWQEQDGSTGRVFKIGHLCRHPCRDGNVGGVNALSSGGWVAQPGAVADQFWFAVDGGCINPFHHRGRDDCRGHSGRAAGLGRDQSGRGIDEPARVAEWPDCNRRA